MLKHIPLTEITADCKHDVVAPLREQELIDGTEGGVYTWEGRQICPDCMRDKIEEMSLKELASLLGSEFITLEELRC